MWLDLRKSAFYTHNSKVNFLHQLIAVHINEQFWQKLAKLVLLWLVSKAYQMPTSGLVVFKWLLMQSTTISARGNQFPSLRTTRGDIPTSFAEEVSQRVPSGTEHAFAHHFIATHPPVQSFPPTPTFHLVAMLVVFATPVKTYLKWQEVKLAIHSIVGE